MPVCIWQQRGIVTVLGILCFSRQTHSPLCFDPEPGFSGLLEAGFLAVWLLVRVSQYETSPGDWGVRRKSYWRDFFPCLHPWWAQGWQGPDSSLTTTVYVRQPCPPALTEFWEILFFLIPAVRMALHCWRPRVLQLPSPLLNLLIPLHRLPSLSSFPIPSCSWLSSSSHSPDR